MYNLKWFEEKFSSKLQNLQTEKSSFKDGQFGDLERIEFESEKKFGTIEFWSQGWINMDIYDCNIDDQIFNILLSPDEKDTMISKIEEFIDLLLKNDCTI